MRVRPKLGAIENDSILLGYNLATATEGANKYSITGSGRCTEVWNETTGQHWRLPHEALIQLARAEGVDGEKREPCGGCGPIDGVIWPVNYSEMPGEKREVQRCDECGTYADDAEAGVALLAHLNKDAPHVMIRAADGNVYVDPILTAESDLHETPMEAPLPPVGTFRVTDGRWPVLEVVTEVTETGIKTRTIKGGEAVLARRPDFGQMHRGVYQGLTDEGTRALVLFEGRRFTHTPVKLDDLTVVIDGSPLRAGDEA